MKECVLIGGGVILAGVFAGCVAYKIAKNPKMFKNVGGKISDVGKKASKAASEAKQAFAEGFETAKGKVATA